jgi:hypothetical protein
MIRKIILFLLVLSGILISTRTQSSANLIINGDFSAGTYGFTSGYNYGGLYLAETTYAVNTDPRKENGFLTSYGDHTTGTGNMLIVNGATSPGVTVWSQTLTVDPNTNYSFSMYVASCYGTNRAFLGVFIDNSQIGGSFYAPSTTGIWDQFNAQWNSGLNSSVTITIVDLNTAAMGNDFSIDDISIQSTVPLPAAFFQLSAGLGVLALWRRKARK